MKYPGQDEAISLDSIERGRTMQTIIPALVIQFNRKGINRDQVLRIIDDIERLAHKINTFSRDRLNLELESLGWGINVVEPPTYELICRLVDKLGSEGQKVEVV